MPLLHPRFSRVRLVAVEQPGVPLAGEGEEGGGETQQRGDRGGGKKLRACVGSGRLICVGSGRLMKLKRQTQGLTTNVAEDDDEEEKGVEQRSHTKKHDPRKKMARFLHPYRAVYTVKRLHSTVGGRLPVSQKQY